MLSTGWGETVRTGSLPMISYAIVLAAGCGRRMGADRPKQFMDLAGKPVLAHTLEAFEQAGSIDRVVLVAPPEQVGRCEAFVKTWGGRKVSAVVPGGVARQDSVAEGLKAVGDEAGVVAVHDAARPLVLPEQIDAVVGEARETGAAVLGTRVTDTVKEVAGERVLKTLDRSRLWSVQTPQAFQADLIRRAHREAARSGYVGTDDTALVERLNAPVRVVEGRRDNLKITTPEDLQVAGDILRRRGETPALALRIGQGCDVHRLVEDRALILGGVEVRFDRGLLGHSDADVLSHAVGDAILGGLGAGDIGQHFPDTDPAYAGVSSLVLLQRVAGLVKEAGAEILNVDATVMAQRPKLAPYIPQMKSRMAGALGISADRVSVKATTTEGLGFVGTGEGMAAQAVVLIAHRKNAEGAQKG